MSIMPDQFPSNPIELQGYDAVILANVPRGEGGLSDFRRRWSPSTFTTPAADW